MGDRLTTEEIRTNYSGFIVFIAKLTTVATGIVFTLLVANMLPQNEYGTLGKFNIIIPYFTLLSGAISFWTMRFVARGKEGAIKTGVAANMTVATIATIIYLTTIPITAAAFKFEEYTLAYAVEAVQIIELYLIAVFEACLQAQRPHFVGYGLIIGEVTKVLLAYVFIMLFSQGLLGVILSLIIAFGIKVAFYFGIILKELRQKLVFNYIKEWLKGSVFNIYSAIGDRIASIIFFMLAIYGGDTGTSYYYAALQIANVITYSSFIAFALTPRLLARNDITEATASLKMVLLFAVPMTVGVLTIPSSYLLFLKESGEYVIATPVLMILAVDALIMTASTVLSYVLYGIEKLDEKAKIPFKQVVKSRLFIAFSLPYVHSAITLPTTFYILNNFASNDPLLVAIYATGINTAAHLAMIIVLYRVLWKAVRLNIPWKSVGKYVAASLIMGGVLLLSHPSRRSTTLVFTAFGGGIYLLSLMVIDKETRMLVRTVWLIAKNKIGGIKRVWTPHG